MINSVQKPIDDIASKFALWQLISPTLPVGAYSFSQGLETAIDQQWVVDMESTYSWILGVAGNNMSQLDLPIFIRCYRAISENKFEDLNHWNQLLISNRETRELRLEDVQMGKALLTLILALEADEVDSVCAKNVNALKKCAHGELHISYACAFALATSQWNISLQESCAGYLWAWCENQVAAAIKLVPLGQTQGQKLLRLLTTDLLTIQAKATSCKDEEIGSSLPGLAMASSWHETQYTRLFRS